MPRFIRFFCYIYCTCAWVCLFLLLCPLCLCLGSSTSSAASTVPMPVFDRFHRCKLFRITWSIVDGKLTNLRRLETVFLSLSPSAMPMPGFFRCAYAWVCPVLLPVFRSSAFSIASVVPLPSLCLYLGLPPSLLRLLCLCLVCVYIWVFRFFCCVCYEFVQFFCWATRPLCACLSVG